MISRNVELKRLVYFSWKHIDCCKEFTSNLSIYIHKSCLIIIFRHLYVSSTVLEKVKFVMIIYTVSHQRCKKKNVYDAVHARLFKSLFIVIDVKILIRSMDSNSDDLSVEEDVSEAQLISNISVSSDPANVSSEHSRPFIPPTVSSSDSISQETYMEQLATKVHKLKAELRAQCHQDWFEKVQPWEHNPKIELGLLLHDALRKETLTKSNDEHMITELFQVNK